MIPGIEQSKRQDKQQNRIKQHEILTAETRCLYYFKKLNAKSAIR